MTGSRRIVGIIPARMASSRFPGKPLAQIAGRTMIEHVYRRAAMNRRFSEVAIATCDEAIAEATRAFGGRAIMTSPTHERGTERVAEAAEQLAADIVVNIQGDEPLVTPGLFDELLAPFDDDRSVSCTNLMSPLASDSEQDSLNNVKVVVNRAGDAMYFSREPIPSRRMGIRHDGQVFRQIGIYAFTREFLLDFNRLPSTPLERAESVDMLRLLEHGRRIRMVLTQVPLQSVDTEADRREAERLMAIDPLASAYPENS
ncbi:MAG: 3-deoxy-manno-octulosonate cytidylyltransferase [Vicinamibacterales bacterium]